MRFAAREILNQQTHAEVRASGFSKKCNLPVIGRPARIVLE